MTALVVSLACVAVACVGAGCFRWWLEFRSADAKAERELRLETARAAPAELAALRAEVLALKSRVESANFR